MALDNSNLLTVHELNGFGGGGGGREKKHIVCCRTAVFGLGWDLNQTLRVSVSCVLAAVHRQSA